MRFNLFITIVLTGSAFWPDSDLNAQTTGIAQDRLETFVAEYITPDTFRTDVARTSAVRVVYLCDGYKGRWIAAFAKLSSAPLMRAIIGFRGLPEESAPNYHNFQLTTASRGDGIFTAFDVGPLADYQKIDPTSVFVPLSFAAVTLEASTDTGATVRANFDRLPETIIQQLARCRGNSFPRVLHRLKQ